MKANARGIFGTSGYMDSNSTCFVDVLSIWHAILVINHYSNSCCFIPKNASRYEGKEELRNSFGEKINC